MTRRLQPGSARDRLIVALDMGDVAAARRLVATLGEAVTFYKIGMQLVFAGGLPLVAELAGSGKQVFFDMKLLDIDNTVAGAVASIAGLGATMTTIHAYPAAMRAAVKARDMAGADVALLGVTVLTSMDDADLAQAGYDRDAAALVTLRAAAAREAGMDGIVCSPLEIATVRRIVGPELAIVTPGIRPTETASGDQKRIATPRDAIAAGADCLVIGRPITGAADPRTAAEATTAEIAAALKGRNG